MAEQNVVCLPSGPPNLKYGLPKPNPNSRSVKLRQTKPDYYYVVSVLDQDTATCLLDIMSIPPEANKYDALKECLLDTSGLSKREHAARLLHTQPLGDSKPSALMDEVLALLGNHHPGFFFEQFFLMRISAPSW